MFEGNLTSVVGNNVRMIYHNTGVYGESPATFIKTFWNEAEQKVVIFVLASGAILYRIGTVGTNSITWTPTISSQDSNGWGTVANWYSTARITTYEDGFDVEWIESLGKYVIAYHPHNDSRCKLAFVSHNTSGGLSVGTATSFRNSSSYHSIGYKHKMAWSESAGKLLFFYQNAYDSDDSYMCEVTPNAGNETFSYSTPVEVTSNSLPASTDRWDVGDIGTGKFLMMGPNGTGTAGSSPDIYGMVRQLSATDLTDTFVGFSDGNYSADATATVLCAGNVSADHSSLSPGTKYYSTGSGGVSATPANPEVFVGTAVTPTTITVKN